MDDDISPILMIFLTDHEIRHEFISCLNQFVVLGNKGRNFKKEYQIKKMLAEYQLPEKAQVIIQKESFFYILYEQTKKFLSNDYLFQKLKEAKIKISTILASINIIFEECTNLDKSECCIPYSNKIIDFCDKLIQFDDQFLKTKMKQTKNEIEKQIIINEINNEFSKKTKINSFTIQCDRTFAISLVSEGLNFAPVERFLAKNNISVCSEKKFYEILHELSGKIIEYSHKICLENFLLMDDNAILAYDASWAHGRRSHQCFGSIINTVSGKIIGWRAINDKNASPQSLEGKILAQMKDIYQDHRVIGHVQDGDLVTINLVKQWNRSIKIYLDPNHMKGKFVRILENFSQKVENCLNPIKNELIYFFKSLLFNKSLTINQKKFQWENAFHHFIGEHGLCLHSYENQENSPDPIIVEPKCPDSKINEDSQVESDDFTPAAPPSEADSPKAVIDPIQFPKLINYLICFLEYTSNLFDLVSPYYQTQNNEALHSTKSKFANKNTKWDQTFELRMAMNVLQKNNPYVYYLDLIEKFNLSELSEHSSNILSKYIKISTRIKKKMLDLSYVSMKNKKRFNLRHKKYTTSGYDHTTRVKEIKKTESEIETILKKFRPIIIEDKDFDKKQKQKNRKDKVVEYESDYSEYDYDNSDSSDVEDESVENSLNESFYLGQSICLYPKPNMNINAGLNNCHNSCFISSSLQFLFQIPFVEDALEMPLENCDELAFLLKDLYFQIKSSDVSCNPIDFVNLYRSTHGLSRVPGDAVETFVNLLSIMKSNFIFDELLYSFQIQQKTECINGHLSYYDEGSIFFELYLLNNVCDNLQDYINETLFEETDSYAMCPTEGEVVECKISNILLNLPHVLIIHVNRYFYSSESQNSERIQCNLNINHDLLINDNNYTFKCALLHFGPRNSGHYQTIIEYDGDYYIYNDAIIDTIDDFNFEAFNENYELIMYINQ